ncbi:MAG: glycosyl hydrolase 2 galactose-binding domain-containing protein [Bacteroidales bacterium]
MNRLFTILTILLAVQTSCKDDNIIERTEIKDKWSFKDASTDKWMLATVPGCVHTDLLANEEIEDPFYRINEKDLQWIDKKDWVYRCNFEISKDRLEKDHIELQFDGLDTYADVFLNGKIILSSDNMFVGHIVNVKDIIKENNELTIYFKSPIKEALHILGKQDYKLPASNDQSTNGGLEEDQRVSPYIRKAPYHFGWDWGPRLVSSGIWRPITLITWDAVRINDIYYKQLSVDKAEASVLAQIELAGENFRNTKIVIKANGKVVAEAKTGVSKNTVNIPIKINNPELWWPNGMGEAYLYDFECELYENGNLVDKQDNKIGLRQIELVTEKDSLGTPFYFKVNGIPVFAKGANYIPNDVFPARVSDQTYEHILSSAQEVNMNMIRVWGGGIYEYEKFYELCDKYGLMVWQDFMFACSMYPWDSTFLKSIEKEAAYNIKRLRNHSCIALWCGNNEIENAWANNEPKGGWGWKQEYTEEQRVEIWNGYLALFHDLLPKQVDKYSNLPYWPSSPSTGTTSQRATEETSNDGDMHYWGVWHGKQEFSGFEEHKSRFVSEYGFQSFPIFSSVMKYTTEEDWDIESEVMSSHQRSGIGNLRIKWYMDKYYNIPEGFEQFLYIGQVLQAEGMMEGMLSHRRNKPFCMGSLLWQLNDVWPVASWSTIDYYGEWKAEQYFIKKAFNTFAVSPHRVANNLVVSMISDSTHEQSLPCTANFKVINFAGEIKSEWSEEFDMQANTSQTIGQYNLSDTNLRGLDSYSVLQVEVESNGKMLCSNLFYSKRVKDLNLPKGCSPQINFTTDGNKLILKISSDKLLKNVYLYNDKVRGSFSDNFFDILPNKEYRVVFISDDNENINTEDFKYMSVANTY